MSEQKNLSKTYDPKVVEEKWYQHWENSNYFKADADINKPHFSIVMPPPNVTGMLHLGHALDNTLQDILTRYKRMRGFNTLWLPGTDHAGIATQARVEAQLSSEGTSKDELGREKFIEKAWQWKEEYGSTITKQLRKLGTSCDWSRERFTMDEGCSEAVKEVFVRLYNKGLIYQGNYIVNWCPHCETTISDIEVEHVDEDGKLYYIKYLTEDGTDFLTIATTRPETMFGDTAVAVHPEDTRYAHLIGTNLVLPFVNKPIPIIADTYVESEFGTGAVKITPAHDPNDFEMGKRHNLSEVVVIDSKGIMNDNAGMFSGMDRYECRKKVIEELEKQGLLIKADDHGHAVGHCYRCSTVIEPRVSKQWFVKMQPLAEPAIKVVKEGKVKFVPERFSKVYLDWLDNIRDWCISRQLWWGHRIPVWYCQDCDELICTKDEPKVCPKCESTHLEQDKDVLDTWFSSGLWPFSTLGWPQDTKDLQRYYPTSVLVTGRDIIFFWVARMIFTSLEFMGEVPFKEVFIHGLVLDAKGRKMSKSLGNGVDPLEVIEQNGADVLRFMLITGNTPGNDIRFQFERLESARNFANKIWNATRFVLMNLDDYEEGKFTPEYNMSDKWILSRYNSTIKDVTRYLENYELGEAGRKLYDFIWNEFCDWYVELAKARLYNKENTAVRYTAQNVLATVLKGTMELLHPVMPFLTEEIWQVLPHEGETIMLTSWPEENEDLINSEIEEQMNLAMEVIRTIRNLRSEVNVPLGKKADSILITHNEKSFNILMMAKEYIKSLATVDNLEIEIEMKDEPEQSVSAVTKGVEIFLSLKGLVDVEKEKARLNKELDKVNKEIERLDKKLSNEGFIRKAPADVIEKEKEKLVSYGADKDALLGRINSLG
ncbi:valyl-tRNA synthetase [Desulfonispora thiosulfatigenes DSM 11270]|uniref:Valine--tRNA ligase n=1 Tax=Desulfonispora thiosulfatigenes DSM 11270 TaxID=656914 RepID=A0A1W1VFM9_DESTI|nr:valine--tRNA ligase [Desulfonispora thiosulfatigenes]SMB92116.1 valyl-tRNA synthetase [Desulfonispora thiosulfatigenes DSM 11270]